MGDDIIHCNFVCLLIGIFKLRKHFRLVYSNSFSSGRKFSATVSFSATKMFFHDRPPAQLDWARCRHTLYNSTELSVAMTKLVFIFLSISLDCMNPSRAAVYTYRVCHSSVIHRERHKTFELHFSGDHSYSRRLPRRFDFFFPPLDCPHLLNITPKRSRRLLCPSTARPPVFKL